MSGLLFGNLLRLFLFLRHQRAYERQGVACHHQASRDNGLPAGNDPITTAFLVFASVSVVHVIFARTGQSEWEEGQIQSRALDLLGIFFDNGERVLHLSEAPIGQRVRLVNIRSRIFEWTFNQWKEWCNEMVVAVISQGKGPLSIWI